MDASTAGSQNCFRRSLLLVIREAEPSSGERTAPLCKSIGHAPKLAAEARQENCARWSLAAHQEQATDGVLKAQSLKSAWGAWLLVFTARFVATSGAFVSQYSFALGTKWY